MIRVVIAEDQKMLSGALASLLTLEDDIEVVAQAADGKAALKAIENYHPDVCLLDIEIPFMTGLEVAEKLREQKNPCKIIIVTTFARPGYLQKALALKVDGYLLKDEPIDFLISSIRKVINGERIISTDLAAALFINEENPLTEREAEILRLVKNGLTTEQIAKTLYLTNGTVRNYLSSAIQKLEAESRHQAIKTASEKGWI
ncbi:response regulator transcription factor [Aneurinibacillus migulanus]|uniref:Transcriptional regulator n=1 Tax=Aneurinibacillus migulanus TaxID=47500 RepID=A0A0D1XVY6_ANEMI|nr:response regulator transcription factor [Aneurinibacillus migulanus]KIV51222.1 transcriptional regulator [Aneurinibacillus migulanus]KON94690.1 transcriptional regulator [Aneurinibacillus migulanus]MED0894778.1 response regulator transcription factor [Aneurinibacillus migulanus]MED1615266.1 response regulator transcription factor [Aneurinibacillus migulanus]SDJ14076.1 two component transcriptional regulator, LuxR family [Aneurinibacillus migulanus]